MADGSIISRDTIRRMGADAFARGDSREDHCMNPWAVALPDWQAGYDAAALASPLSHIAPHRRGRVELAQGVAV